jgi:hypothetical protein
MGRILIGAGVVLLVAGLLVMGLQRFGLGVGRLPGDFVVRGRNWTLFAPLGTSLLLSVLVTLILIVLARFRR